MTKLFRQLFYYANICRKHASWDIATRYNYPGGTWCGPDKDMILPRHDTPKT